MQNNIEQIIDIVLTHYHWAIKTWGRNAVHDLEGMPDEVTRKNLLSAIPERSITVDNLGEEGEDEKPYLCSISFGIPYDPEHGLQLGFEDGQITTVNDSEFSIENGWLKYAWE